MTAQKDSGSPANTGIGDAVQMTVSEMMMKIMETNVELGMFPLGQGEEVGLEDQLGAHEHDEGCEGMEPNEPQHHITEGMSLSRDVGFYIDELIDSFGECMKYTSISGESSSKPRI